MIDNRDDILFNFVSPLIWRNLTSLLTLPNVVLPTCSRQ